MKCFEVHLDYKTSEHAGAGGMFQVFSIKDHEDVDCTDLIDQGQHFHDMKQLTAAIAKALGVDESEISLTETC